MWTLKDLIEHSNTTSTEINGKWVPGRPINWQYRTLKERLKQAWAVFVGKAEAFTWSEGQ